MGLMMSIKKLPFILLSLILSTTTNTWATTPVDPWKDYIDKNIGTPTYYLYPQAIQSFHPKKGRALDLGSGSGEVDVALAAKGWNVTGVDTSPRSGEVIAERTRHLNGQFHFQQTDFASIKLAGNYNLVVSFSALPFGNKQDLPGLIKNIAQHMQSGSIFAANFFGYQHSFVKKGDAYGINKNELDTLFKSTNFEIKFFLNRSYDQKDFHGNETYWDVLDVIALKK